MEQKNILATTGVLVLTLLMITTGSTQAATLLFKSGFEPNTTLGPVTGTAPNGPNQTILGTDNSSGSTWISSLPFGPSAGLTGIHIIPPHASSDANSSHFFNILDNSTVHSGSRSLKLSMTGYPDNNCCSQNVFNMIGMNQSITQLYMRLWMKLGPEIPAQLAANKNQFWRDLFEIKTTNDYRIISYIFGNSSGQAYWSAHADNNPNDTFPPNGSPITFWQQNNTTVPVPLSAWFEVEVYLKRSTGSDGIYQMAINGTTIVSQSGANYGSNNEKINQWMFANSYGPFNPQTQWIDDLELWDSPPCASFPCGAGTTSGSAPAITSATSATATKGSAFSYQITGSNSPTSYGATGLPTGLSVNSTSGLISGTPSVSGSFNVSLSATNSTGTGNATLALTVNAGGNSCDLNGDGSVTVSDVQMMVNQALGVSTCTSGNLQKTNPPSCNSIDVQRVINSALGGQCVTGP